MSFSTSITTLHEKLLANRYAQLFTAFVRCLLALGFIPPSIPKITHRPFTTIGVHDPVGAYFDALYKTGYYYDFIGWSQLLAAVLLLIPATAHLGAFLFMPIIVNIAVLTNSVGFKGTWLVTILMTLACAWLVCWEYDRLKKMMPVGRYVTSRFTKTDRWLVPLIFVGGALCFIILGLSLGTVKWETLPLFQLSMFLLMGLGFGLVVYLHFRYMKTGKWS